MQQETQKLGEKLEIGKNIIKKQLSVVVLVWIGIMAFLVFVYGIFIYQLFFSLGILYTILSILLFLSLLLLIYAWKKGLYLFTGVTMAVFTSFLIEFAVNYYPYFVGSPRNGSMDAAPIVLFLSVYLLCVSLLGSILLFILWKNHKENLIN